MCAVRKLWRLAQLAKSSAGGLLTETEVFGDASRRSAGVDSGGVDNVGVDVLQAHDPAGVPSFGLVFLQHANEARNARWTSCE